MMTEEYGAYLDATARYAGELRVAALDMVSEALSLDDVFLEPEASGRGNAASIPANRVLREHKCVVLTGQPGQGKSTLLRHWSSRIAQDDARSCLPVLVELGRERGKIERPERYEWLRQRLPDPIWITLGEPGWARVSDVIDRGEAWVGLDGLDELSPEGQQQVEELVADLAHRGNRITLTTRPVGYKRPLREFTVFKLEPLNRTQAETLAWNICSALAKVEGNDAHLAWRQVLRTFGMGIATLTGNPLFLSFFCLLATTQCRSAENSTLPNQAGSIIHGCLEALVQWHRIHKRSWPKTVELVDLIRVLSPLALATFQSRKGTIASAEIQRLPESERQLIHECVVPAQLLHRQNAFEYAFHLETFREYFAALAIAAHEDPFAALRPHLLDPRWEKVFIYTAGLCQPGRPWWPDRIAPSMSRLFVRWFDPLVKIGAGLLQINLPKAAKLEKGLDAFTGNIAGKLRKKQGQSRHTCEYFLSAILRDAGREPIFLEDIQLAARCAGNMVSVSPSFAALIVDRLLYRDHEVLGWRRGSSLFLDALREAAVSAEIRQRLMHWSSRRLTISKRGFRRGPQIGASCVLLTFLYEKDVVPHFLSLVGDASYRYDLDSWAEDAAQQLANHERVRAELLRLTEERPELRRNCIVALRGQTDREDVRDRLLTLSEDSDFLVRAASLEALASSVENPTVKDRFFACVADGQAWVRRETALGLARIATDPAARQLLFSLAEDKSEIVREAVAKSLSTAIMHQQAEEYVLKLTFDKYPEVRAAALNALKSKIKISQVRERVFELALDSDVKVRDAAYGILAQLRDDTAQALLLNAFEKSERARLACLTVFDETGLSVEAKVALLALTKHSDLDVREVARTILYSFNAIEQQSFEKMRSRDRKAMAKENRNDRRVLREIREKLRTEADNRP